MLYKSTDFTKNELKQAVQIQIKEISQGFLSSFGEKALSLIFIHIVSCKVGIAVLAINEKTGRVIGYVLGTLSTKKLYGDFILKKTPQALFYFLPRLLSYQKIKKALETLLYPSKKLPDDFPEPELLDIAVVSEFHGTEVAKDLFMHFVDELRQRGITKFKIPTAATLERAHKFYEKMGAVQKGFFTLHEVQKTFYYVYPIK